MVAHHHFHHHQAIGVARPVMLIEEDNDQDSICCGGKSSHHQCAVPQQSPPPSPPSPTQSINKEYHCRSRQQAQRRRRPPSFFKFPCNPQDLRRQKRQFLIFIRILVGYLDRKDPLLCRKVHRAVRECSKRHKQQHQDKRLNRESAIIRIHTTLREMVNEHHWARAVEYFHFLFPPADENGGLGHYYIPDICNYYFQPAAVPVPPAAIVPPDHPPAEQA